MWQWDQRKGQLSRDGKVIASGYSGNGLGVNNPSMQGVQGVGPIPQGLWRIVSLTLTGASTGPYTLVLMPERGTDTLGRSDFRIHGDNFKMDNSASHGCIILPRTVREQIWQSGDKELTVIA